MTDLHYTLLGYAVGFALLLGYAMDLLRRHRALGARTGPDKARRR